MSEDHTTLHVFGPFRSKLEASRAIGTAMGDAPIPFSIKEVSDPVLMAGIIGGVTEYEFRAPSRRRERRGRLQGDRRQVAG